MKKLISVMMFFLMLFSIINFSPTISYACSCAAPGPVKEEMDRSSAVFSGKVVGIIDKNKHKPIQSSADPIEVKFEVAEIWKGQSQTEIIIYTERDSASCGFEFNLNNDYLVYANEVEGELRVSLCSRTALLTAAGSDIQELGTGEKPVKQISNDSNKNKEEQQTTNKNQQYIIALFLGVLLAGCIFAIRRRKK